MAQASFFPSKIGVLDELTSPTWHTKASVGRKAATWSEALANVDSYANKSKLPWRMPTINELESLVDASAYSPALPGDRPFSDMEHSFLVIQPY
ncbi:MAG: DUF1566 domain-containing protein [Desulforhopalus sp.]